MRRRKLERVSDKYVIYYLQTRACVVEWPGQCHFLLCRWQSLKQSVWTDDRVTGVDRDISTSVPLELFAKTLETGNILQQVTTNYLKWSHAGLMLETVNITQGFCCVSQLWWHGGYVTSEQQAVLKCHGGDHSKQSNCYFSSATQWMIGMICVLSSSASLCGSAAMDM